MDKNIDIQAIESLSDMRRALGFIIIMAAVLLSSCKERKVERELADIDSYIQEKPDSALMVLERLNLKTLKTKKAKAQYSLLYATALDKNYIDTTDLDIIAPALAYYSEKGDLNKLLQTWFYLGRIQENREDYPNALISYFNALKYLDGDIFYQGMINASIADVYNVTFNNEEELKYADIAYKCFEQLGDKKHIDIAKYKLAQACFNNGLYERADSIYSSVYSDSDSTSIVATTSILGQVQNDMLGGNPDYKQDLYLLDFVLSVNGSLSEIEYYQYVYCLLQLGETHSAEEMLEALAELPENKQTLGWRYRIAEFQGQFDKALRLFEDLSYYQDSVVSELLKASVFKAQSNYYKSSAEISKQKEQILRQNSMILSFVVLFVLCLLVGIIILFKRKDLRDKELILLAEEEKEKLSKDVQELSGQNRKYENSIAVLRQSYLNLYRRQFNEIGRYYDVYLTKKSDEIEKTLIKSIKAFLKEISNNSNQRLLEKRIDADLDNVISKIRQDFPKYKDDDIRFICYVIIGLDSSSIAFLLNISKENVRVKRYRFRSKLMDYSGPNEGLYQLFI